MSQILTLNAPISGRLIPLVTVPDKVFSQKMVGDGVSIDPISNLLLAPCDGTITQLHSAHHAITIAHDSGVEILIHIGLDTVLLKGKGFTPHVAIGEYVTSGTLLISFDADYIATHARSLLTQLVITHGEVIRYISGRGTLQAGKDIALTLHINPLSKDKINDKLLLPLPTLRSECITIINPAGLHARPAALIANTAKKFNAKIVILHGEKKINAKSIVSILSSEIQYADSIYIEAQGSQREAQEAINQLQHLILQGIAENENVPAESVYSTLIEAEQRESLTSSSGVLYGMAASPGLAVGRIFQLNYHTQEIDIAKDTPEVEQKRLLSAFQKASADIEKLRDDIALQVDSYKAAIFSAHQELLADPDLINGALQLIEKGDSAVLAWQCTFTQLATQLSKLNNPLMATRADDLHDIGQRVLSILTGADRTAILLPEQAILIAEMLTPSEIASLDRSKVLGICTTNGGTTSHAAILARALGIPLIVGIDARALSIANGTPAILDGVHATLRLQPNKESIAVAVEQQKSQIAQHESNIATAQEIAQTQDGHRINVEANISDVMEATQSIDLGGEGIGLLRSEFLFLHRNEAPSEAEQSAVYIRVAKTMGLHRPMVVRTLDVGGDKPLAYLAQPPEDNPFLGMRGVRLCLDHPDILRTQICAIIQAAPYTQLHIMFPMITTLEELSIAKAIVKEECAQLGNPRIKIGIMIEVPAAALMAAQFAPHVDFFSIGSNDLTQYTLATDRGHPKLARQVDALNPAVLQLMALAIDGAHQQNKWIGICGELASDILALPILIGMGIDKVSVSVPAIPAIKAHIRRLNLSTCEQWAKEILSLKNAAEVRSRLESIYQDLIKQ